MTQLFTASELQRLSLDELQGLHRRTRDALVRSEPCSPERRNALASLENIQRAICDRLNNEPAQRPQ